MNAKKWLIFQIFEGARGKNNTWCESGYSVSEVIVSLLDSGSGNSLAPVVVLEASSDSVLWKKKKMCD